MNHIQSKHMIAGLLCLAAFCICLVTGFRYWVLFIPAALFLCGYILIDRRYLRCPNCGAFTNLDRLFYARKHRYHCSHCGEVVYVQK